MSPASGRSSKARKTASSTRDGARSCFATRSTASIEAQQDAFLPWVENGVVALIGATTENPSFELTGALLSRCRVFVLEPLSEADVRSVVQRALADAERGLGALHLGIDDDALALLAREADGDARRALQALEAAAEYLMGKREEDAGRVRPRPAPFDR